MNDENGYTFRTPTDWGTITGALLVMEDDEVVYFDIDPESDDLKLETEEK